MKAAGSDHSNILLIIMIAAVLGLAGYGVLLYFGGWVAFAGLLAAMALVVCLLMLLE